MARRSAKALPQPLRVDLDNCLVVGVSSSALFDLSESDAYFLAHGEAAYRDYQDERLDEPLAPGVAFPFVQRLLGLNDLARENQALVEVIILSRNDVSTGLRVMRSIDHHRLPITRAFFTQGQAPFEYIDSMGMSLFLTRNRDDVDLALKAGFPAGHVLPSTAQYDAVDRDLRVAFDFDGVLADDEAEKVYKKSKDIATYLKSEHASRDRALKPGPLERLLRDLNAIQQVEAERSREDATYQPRLRIALVTARNAPAHERAVLSMRAWGVHVNDAFFLGGLPKSRVLEVLKPHIFFDDQTVHLDGASGAVVGVHIPFGVANESKSEGPK